MESTEMSLLVNGDIITNKKIEIGNNNFNLCLLSFPCHGEYI